MHRPPLSREDLQRIQEGHRRNPDVIALLWEIHRLRAIALRADQLLSCIDDRQEVGLIADVLRDQLKDEPAIKEMAVLKRQVLDRPK